jgi:HPt (histidine-containing phosphotransfer) domain-containing protein
MADSREHLQRQMAEIGNRYLRRTIGELARLREIVARLGEGAQDLYEELEHLAHRIRGSGAMFGFDALSEQAGLVEKIASERTLDPPRLQELQQQIATLEQMVLEAARSRGIEVS